MNEPKYKVGEVYNFFDGYNENDRKVVKFIKIISSKIRKTNFDDNTIIYIIQQCDEDGNIKGKQTAEWNEYILSQWNLIPIIEYKKQHMKEKLDKLNKLKLRINKLEKQTLIDINN